MNFAHRLRTSWELLLRSLQVIRLHPRLALFPIVSAAATMGLALFFFVPVLLFVFNRGGEWLETWGAWGRRMDHMTKDEWRAALQGVHGLVYAYGAVIYLVSLLAATFFNVAFYHQILRALGGETVSLREGWDFALSRWRSIVLWSLLAGTVGLIIRAIEERLGWLGRIVMAFIGAAWSIASVFAIPVIIRREDSDPLAVLKDSAATLKKTWGESLAGFVGIQLGGALMLVAVVAFGVTLTIVAGRFHLMPLALSLCALWLLAVIAMGFLLGMATHIYRCALYVYASEGVVPEPYTAALMDAGWKVKKK